MGAPPHSLSFPGPGKGAFLPPRSFLGLSPEEFPLDRARTVILPVPYDSTATYRPGAREGPRAIIDASQELEFYDLELGRELHTAGIYTLPEVEPSLASPEAMVERVYQIGKELVAGGKLLALLGGEHTLALGPVRALKEAYPDLSVLFLDAHADLREDYLGARVGHATVLRRLLELAPAVVVGLRCLSLEEMAFLKEKGIPFFPMEAGREISPGEVVPRLSPRVYISLDLDVLDPSLMPAVGNPQPGGMGWGELLALLRGVAEARHILGFDVSELCPREASPSGSAVTAATLVYKLIGYSSLKGQE